MCLLQIVHLSHDKDIDTEGCLSFPDTEGSVQRSLRVKVEHFDVDGTKRTIRLSGYPARIFQHEYDHLNGVSISFFYFHVLIVLCTGSSHR